MYIAKNHEIMKLMVLYYLCRFISLYELIIVINAFYRQVIRPMGAILRSFPVVVPLFWFSPANCSSTSG